MKKLKVINCFAGPGAGKSTTAAGVFSALKLLGYNAELATEYAKDLTWEQRQLTLQDQVYVFAKQQKRLRQLAGQVDVVVTDSPLLLSLIYNQGQYAALPALIQEVWSLYDNYNYFIERVKPYNPIGRNQSEAEAQKIDRTILDQLKLSADLFLRVPGNIHGINLVLSDYARSNPL